MSGPTDGLSPADVDAAADAIRTSRVFVTQLEQPVAAAQLGLEIARAADSITVFNPAPAGAFDDSLFALCDYVVPNETKAEALTGIPVSDLAGARRAGDALLGKGAGTVLITLAKPEHCFTGRIARCTCRRLPPARVVETAGAGDAFVGGFASALAGGAGPLEAARFGSATARISVTRAGAAPAMPRRAEIETLLKG